MRKPSIKNGVKYTVSDSVQIIHISMKLKLLCVSDLLTALKCTLFELLTVEMSFERRGSYCRSGGDGTLAGSLEEFAICRGCCTFRGKCKDVMNSRFCGLG